MLCAKCGKEIGENEKVCSNCRVDLLLRAGRVRAMRTVALPLIAAFFLFGLLVAYGIKSYFWAEKPEIDLDLELKVSRPNRQKTPVISIVPTQVSGYVIDELQKISVVSARASYIFETKSLVLQLFEKSGVRGESLFGELSLELKAENLNNCKQSEVIKLTRFDSGGTRVILDSTAEGFELFAVYKCQLEEYGDGKKKVSLKIVSAPDSKEEISFSFRGPVIERAQSQVAEFSTEEMFQLALWDARSGTIEVGFFAEKPSMKDLEYYHKQQMLLRGGGLRPKFGISVRILDEIKKLEPKFTKSYRVVLPKYLDGPDSETIDFSSTLSSGSGREFVIDQGALAHGKLLSLRLEDTKTSISEELQATYLWKLLVSAPLLDVRSSELKSLTPKIAKISKQLPTETSGVVQTSSSKVAIVDSIALYFPPSNTMTIALYSELLSAEDREKILDAKSVWSAKKVAKPISVVSIEMSPDDSVVRVALTFLRSFLGDFYFQGEKNRASFVFSERELSGGTLLSFAKGDVESKEDTAIRFRANRGSNVSSDNFYWDFSVSTKAHVIK